MSIAGRCALLACPDPGVSRLKLNKVPLIYLHGAAVIQSQLSCLSTTTAVLDLCGQATENRQKLDAVVCAGERVC